MELTGYLNVHGKFFSGIRKQGAQHGHKVADFAQTLEGVLGFVIHGAAGAFRNPGCLELGDDLVDGAGVRFDRKRDVSITERAVALAVARQIERDDGNVFALGIGPDVALGPMQDRMHAQMRARRRRGVEVVPEFGRLVAHVPQAFGAARREHALLGAGGLFIAPDAGDQSVEAVLGERELETFGLACGRARGGRQRRIDGVDRRTRLDQQIELPLLGVAVAKRVHLRKFLAGIDVHGGEGHAAEEGLAREPDHHVGIFSERPQEGDPLEARERFAKDENALRFQLVQAIQRASLRPVLAADRWPEAIAVSFLVSTLIFLSHLHSQLVEYFSICRAVLLCIWQIILVNPKVPPMNFIRAIFTPACAARSQKSIRACGKESIDPIGAFAR